VAQFFYVNGISFNVAKSPYFKRMVEALKCAPAGYKPPCDGWTGFDAACLLDMCGNHAKLLSTTWLVLSKSASQKKCCFSCLLSKF
jgi:hypothetical protein